MNRKSDDAVERGHHLVRHRSIQTAQPFVLNFNLLQLVEGSHVSDGHHLTNLALEKQLLMADKHLAFQFFVFGLLGC